MISPWGYFCSYHQSLIVIVWKHTHLHKVEIALIQFDDSINNKYIGLSQTLSKSWDSLVSAWFCYRIELPPDFLASLEGVCTTIAMKRRGDNVEMIMRMVNGVLKHSVVFDVVPFHTDMDIVLLRKAG